MMRLFSLALLVVDIHLCVLEHVVSAPELLHGRHLLCEVPAYKMPHAKLASSSMSAAGAEDSLGGCSWARGSCNDDCSTRMESGVCPYYYGRLIRLRGGGFHKTRKIRKFNNWKPKHKRSEENPLQVFVWYWSTADPRWFLFLFLRFQSWMYTSASKHSLEEVRPSRGTGCPSSSVCREKCVEQCT